MSTLFEQQLADLTGKLRINTECISWQIFRMLRTFLLCVIGRLIFMGQGIGSSVYMIKSIVLHRSRIYDIVNDFSLAEGEWRVILIGCLVLLLVSVAQGDKRAQRMSEGHQRLAYETELVVQMAGCGHCDSVCCHVWSVWLRIYGSIYL